MTLSSILTQILQGSIHLTGNYNYLDLYKKMNQHYSGIVYATMLHILFFVLFQSGKLGAVIKVKEVKNHFKYWYSNLLV